MRSKKNLSGALVMLLGGFFGGGGGGGVGGSKKKPVPRNEKPCIWCGTMKLHNNAFCSVACRNAHKSRKAKLTS